MRKDFGNEYQKQSKTLTHQRTQELLADMLRVPVYILGKTPSLDDLNAFLAQFGCQTNLSLLRPVKVWANLEEDIINEADKVIAQFIQSDLESPVIVVILPPLVALAAALVARMKERCPTLKVLVVHYRVEHEPHFLGFELFCG
jgi:hypothetical protein